MRRTMLGSAVALGALAVLACHASASQVVMMTPRQMAEHSETIVTGRVDRVSASWNEAHTKIFTKIEVTVDQSYKGEARGRVEVLQLGGVVGNVKVTVEGALVWQTGDEVLLFLEPYPGGGFQVAGMSQGRFEIERDPETGDRYVSRPPFEGIELIRPDGETEGGNGTVEKVTLEQFMSEVLAKE